MGAIKKITVMIRARILAATGRHAAAVSLLQRHFGKTLANRYSLSAEEKYCDLMGIERLLYLTHTPQHMDVGKVLDGYLITRIVRTTNTGLIDGGWAPCYEVFGVRK